MSHGTTIALIVGGAWFGFNGLDWLLNCRENPTRNYIFNALLGIMGALMYIADHLP